MAGLAQSERLSKRLILLLMEREIVRRGYHLAHFLPPIERMEEQRPGGSGALSASAAIANAAAQDSSTHIRALLHRSFLSEIALAQHLSQTFVETRLVHIFHGCHAAWRADFTCNVTALSHPAVALDSACSLLL